MFRLIFLCLALRIDSVLIRVAIVAASLFVDVVGPPGDLRPDILRIRALRLWLGNGGSVGPNAAQLFDL